MTIYTLQYDMGLRLWVLTGPQGQTLATWLSRMAALHDAAVRAVVERGGILRVRNADGTWEPVDAPAPPDANALRQVPATAATALAGAAP